jgi:DNA-directed RNA polymerase sigma subunit (sigma70/sigma32)
MSPEFMGDLTISTKNGDIRYSQAMKAVGIGTTDMPLEEIGKIIGVTRERIRQIVEVSLEKLQQSASEYNR